MSTRSSIYHYFTCNMYWIDVYWIEEGGFEPAEI